MTKYALCVGNNYPGTDYALNGCVNDANDWAEMLSRYGYKTQIVLEATRTDLLFRLEDLVARMRYGDRLVFTYSGHGSWVQDASGDEEDQRDECMVMAGLERLLDDELQSMFRMLKIGTGALTLPDSCFSGSVTRFVDLQVANRNRPRFLSPEHFTNMTAREASYTEQATVVSRPRAESSLISGCSDQEFSYDAWFGERPNGAFTRAAIDAYKPGQSLNAWFKAIRTVLPSSTYPQTPQLTPASVYRRYAKAL